MIALVFGLLGLIVGSFLNVVILRHGVRSIGGRSGCMSCGTQLVWSDMIPIFSWLMLRGRCRICCGRVSAQYPIVEATTGVLFAAVGVWVGSIGSGIVGSDIALTLLYLCILAVLVCIAAYDILHTIIPDEWVYAFAGLAFVSQFLRLPSEEWVVMWFAFAGPVVAAPLFIMWLFSRGRWMGLGDAKLALGIGWLLGPALGLVAVMGAFVIGAIVSVCILLPLPHIIRWLYTCGITSHEKSYGGFTMKSEIPFGPFLILSCIIIWFASIYEIDGLRIFGLLLLSNW